MSTEAVCYVDGWHHSVVEGPDGYDLPGERLYLEDDGTYRPAVEGDLSWHERKHDSYARIELADGMPGMTVTAEEMAEIRKMLAERRES